MTWLVTHMYAILAATGVASLLLGWAVRGAFARARIDKVIGERRILQADLDGSKEEIERLYSAQRRASLDTASAGDPAVKAELESREKRIADLTSEVNRLKSEAKKPSGGAGVAPAAVVAQADEEPTLIWRNRHLESRIRHLESLAPAAPAQTATPLPVVAAAPSGIDSEKIEWRLNYLATRAKALEDELAQVKAPAASAIATETPPPAPAGEAGASAEQEELARLRWRNRFLEGRVAYFEGEQSGKKADAAPDPVPAPLMETAPAAAAGAVAVVAASTARETAPLASALLSHLERADAEIDAKEAAVAAPVKVEKVQPQALKGPVGGKPDDLTAIGGIGPKIQDVLFKLGIYHFDQIAAWTPENIAWVNQHLDFEGRIQREGWVEQASVLAGEA